MQNAINNAYDPSSQSMRIKWNIAVWDAIYTMVAYYDTTDPTYNYSYYAQATPWASLESLSWRVFRIQENKSGQFISQKWTGTLFNNPATDLVTVEALTYN